MSVKTLSANNRYLKDKSATMQIVINVSTSTAIETGKSSRTYINRYRYSGGFAVSSEQNFQKK